MHRGLADGAGVSAVQSPFEVLNVRPILTNLLVEIKNKFCSKGKFFKLLQDLDDESHLILLTAPS